MRVSEKRKQAAYDAISDPIMDLRISTKLNEKRIDALKLDDELFKLEAEIWGRLKKVLNIEDA